MNVEKKHSKIILVVLFTFLIYSLKINIGGKITSRIKDFET